MVRAPHAPAPEEEPVPAVRAAGTCRPVTSRALVDIGWPGDSLGALPDVLPGIPRPVTRTALVRHRYGYTAAEPRAALGARVAGELRALGMTPVLPGHFGTVPPGFAERSPGARVRPQGTWDGFARPDWLDPAGPVFASLTADHYAAQHARFGGADEAERDRCEYDVRSLPTTWGTRTARERPSSPRDCANGDPYAFARAVAGGRAAPAGART
ncbi:alpha-N-acetylglucosaminidase TIM-barrel domain-containing protein [Streptomyces sp. NPDC085665]|uniref:alpha-N-acetylglucosaminidase TIM-barrel domain-containing protein n=1 Tax=Streptomyces sp. NPDC085665 TaxID=3365735 RepID=UPI0037CDE233